MKKKWIILFSTFLCLGCLAKKKISEQPKTTAADFQLVWQDDFNGSVIDTIKWSRITEGAPDWKNYMTTDDQVYEVADGYLYLKGLVNTDTQTDPRPYLTGGVWTRDKFNFTYGKVEVRAKMESAKGSWPAIWLLSRKNDDSWPANGEIDIMEHLNFDNFIHSTIHSSIKSSPSTKTVNVNPGEFNTYGVEWYPNKIIFTINEAPTFTYHKEAGADWRQWPFDRDFHLILSQQLGGAWVGNVDSSQLPVDFVIDYVKYYEYNPSRTTALGSN